VTIDHWTFGRRGQGYISLYSAGKSEWVSDTELRAPKGSTTTVCICEVGSVGESGSFQEFTSNISFADVLVQGGGTKVIYKSPRQEEIQFGWDAPSLIVDGEARDLGPHPRYENPFSSIEWGANAAAIHYHGNSLELDFTTGTRVEQKLLIEET